MSASYRYYSPTLIITQLSDYSSAVTYHYQNWEHKSPITLSILIKLRIESLQQHQNKLRSLLRGYSCIILLNSVFGVGLPPLHVWRFIVSAQKVLLIKCACFCAEQTRKQFVSCLSLFSSQFSLKSNWVLESQQLLH